MKFLNLQTDFAFKRVFGNARKSHITMSFLNAVFNFPEGEKIVDLTFIDPYNKPDAVHKKMSIVDVKCTNKKGHKFIIEMQAKGQSAYPQRAQHYVFSNVADQLDKGERFDKLLPVYFVGVVKFSMNKQKKSAPPISHYVIMNKQEVDGKMVFDDDGLLSLASWVFVDLTKFNKKLDACKSLVDEWMYVLKYAEKLDEIPALLGVDKAIHDALELLNSGGMTEKELAEYKEELDALMVEEGVLSFAEAKGIEMGKAEAKIELAKKMLKKMSPAEVAEVTGLSIEEIQKL